MYLEIMKKKKKDYLGNFELSNTETVWWPKKKPDETLEHYLSLQTSIQSDTAKQLKVICWESNKSKEP